MYDKRGLVGPVGNRIEDFVAIASAELELVIAADPRVVLLDADDLGELAARHDAVQLRGAIAGIDDVSAPFTLNGFGVRYCAEMSCCAVGWLRLYCQSIRDSVPTVSTNMVGLKVWVQEPIAVCESS